jgi:hypothetical protein
MEYSGQVSHVHTTQAAMGRILSDPESLAAARQLAARAAAMSGNDGGEPGNN